MGIVFIFVIIFYFFIVLIVTAWLTSFPEKGWKKILVLFLTPLTAYIVLVWDIPIINWEFEKLCKAEAGIHVYEEVVLGPEYWKEDGTLNLPLADHRLTSAMPKGFEFVDLGKSNRSPITRIQKYHYQIKRERDQKILGELKRFSKGSGWFSWGAFLWGGGARGKMVPNLKRKALQKFSNCSFQTKIQITNKEVHYDYN
jgi:hypothetical protein